MSKFPDLVRIMRSEAQTFAAVARVMARMRASVAVQPLGEGHLVALGRGRYVNRAVGVGPELSEPEIATIETFFRDRGLPPSIQLGSLAGDETLERLGAQGFRAECFRWVMAAPIDSASRSGAGPAEIVEVDDQTAAEWMHVLAEANRVTTHEARSISDEFAAAAHAVESSSDLLALIDGEPVGAASIEFADGIGWLGGAATLPAMRGRGIQRQLLDHRVALAAKAGCDLVAATATPGSVSARNLARSGLLLVDVQTDFTAR